VPLTPAALVIGNPPWVAWDALGAGYKEKLARGPLRELDAFDRVGFEARLGAANDDVSALFALVALAHLVAPGGRLAFLLKWNLISNETARVLRRFEVRLRPALEDSPERAGGAKARAPVTVPFAVERLCDLRRCNPFEAAVEPALWILRRDRAMEATLPAERWIRRTAARGARGDGGDVEMGVEVVPEDDYSPVEAHHPEGPWAPGSAQRDATRALEGTFGWEIRHGLKHDCNGVFLLEVVGSADAAADPATAGAGEPEQPEPEGSASTSVAASGATETAEAVPLLRVRNRPRTSRRIRVAPWEGTLEATHIHPLLQSRHVRPFSVLGWGHVLAPLQGGKVVDEAPLRAGAPRTFGYLAHHREALAARRSRVFVRPPFYRLFGVGPYNDAAALLVWSGMGFRPWFVAVDRLPDPWLGPARPLVDGSCYLVPVTDPREAFYLSGLLNARPVRDFLSSRSSGSKRGLSRAVLSRLRLPPWDPAAPAHRRLARAARDLTRIGPGVTEPTALEREEVEALARALLPG